MLVAGGRGVGAEFGARRAAVSRIALPVNAIGAAAVLVVGTPDDYVATIRQAGNGHLGLVAQGLRVGLELGAEGGPFRVVTLREHAVAVAVLRGLRGPGDDVAAVVGAV